MIVPAQIEQHEARKARHARMTAPSHRLLNHAREIADRERERRAYEARVEAARRAEEAATFERLLSMYREVPIGQAALGAREIQRKVARATGFAIEEICSSRRQAELVRARQFAMWLVKNQTDLSLPQIGRRFGGRDHTTVLHACRKIDGLVASGTLPPEFSALLPSRGERL